MWQVVEKRFGEVLDLVAKESGAGLILSNSEGKVLAVRRFDADNSTIVKLSFMQYDGISESLVDVYSYCYLSIESVMYGIEAWDWLTCYDAYNTRNLEADFSDWLVNMIERGIADCPIRDYHRYVA